MSLINYGEEIYYASSRLRSSVVMNSLGDTVVMVNNVEDDENIFYCSDLITGQSYEYELEELDMAPLKLGYANKNGVASFLSRIPNRYYKQGLTQQTLHSPCAYTAPKYNSPSLARCALGMYPSLLECAEFTTCGEVESMAFSRNFSVQGLESSLVFRGRNVGKVIHSVNDGLVYSRLDEKFKFLQEMMEDETSI